MMFHAIEVRTLEDVWDAWGSGRVSLDDCVRCAIELAGGPPQTRGALAGIVRAALQFGLNRHLASVDFGPPTCARFNIRDGRGRLHGRVAIEHSEGLPTVVRVEGPRGGRRVEASGDSVLATLRDAIDRARWLRWRGVPVHGVAACDEEG